jgi:hypothetical protein
MKTERNPLPEFNTVKNIRASVYTPKVFIRTPDSIAEMGAGADEWASGSHA